jgi:trehalose 2-sulfotransferase
MSADWIAADTACYTIAFTVRSGSSLLCDYLRASGFGDPAEYFQYPLGVANATVYRDLGVAPDDFGTFLTTLVRMRSSNGIFGSKLTWDHHNVLVDAIRNEFGRHEGVAALSPRHRWIHLTRRDKIAQAISLARAFTSRSWASATRHGGAATEVDYDFFRLLTALQAIVTEEYLWADFFERHSIEPVRVLYEDLVREPARTVFRLARAVQDTAGVDVIRSEADVRLTTALAVQRDEHSAALAARMRNDLEHIGVTDHWQPRARELAGWLQFFREERWRDDPSGSGNPALS